MIASPDAGKRIAIVQSNYIPWKGYFDLINSVDECILYDDAQYTTRDWRNRNRIKTREGLQWLSIPIQVAGRRTQRICDAEIGDPRWARKHWQTLRRSYARAPGFQAWSQRIADVYGGDFIRLSDVNRRFIEVLCEMLGIRTTITWSADYDLSGGRSERLVGLCRQAGAAEYLSGPSARAYLDERLFAEAGIAVRYMDYTGYPEYPQLHGPFEHAVSILDLLFNAGPDATRFMKTFGLRTGSKDPPYFGT